MRPLLAIIALGLASASAFALQTARMALPEEFETHAERMPISGFGGYNRGSSRLGTYTGECTRDESRLGVFDPLYVKSKGKSSFTLSGPGFDEAIAAAFVVGQKKPASMRERLIARADRVGEAQVFERRIVLRDPEASMLDE